MTALDLSMQGYNDAIQGRDRRHFRDPHDALDYEPGYAKGLEKIEANQRKAEVEMMRRRYHPTVEERVEDLERLVEALKDDVHALRRTLQIPHRDQGDI
jgi:hypothetical protein